MAPDRLSRRRFIEGTALAALTAGLSGCGSDGGETPTAGEDGATRIDPSTPTDATPTGSPTPTGTPTSTPVPEVVAEYGDRFDSIVNIVEAGGDNEGSEPINDVLADRLDDDTLVYFPAGRYVLDRLVIRDLQNFGFVSIPHEQTQIVPARPIDEMGNHFIDFRGVDDILLDGLEFDFTEEGFGGAVRVIADGNVIARNLRTAGPLPDKNKSNDHVAYRFEVRDPEANGLVERLIARDGGHDGGNGVGIFVGKDHAGSLTFRDCEVANFPNNGLYGSAPGQTLDGYTGANGDVHVHGGRYENNNIANVRIGSTGSTVKNVTVVVDKVPPSMTDRGLNVRGIRLRVRNDQLIENCDIRIGEDAGMGFGAISYHPMHGSSTVRDTEIQVDRDGYHAINATHSERGGTEKPLEFDNVTITGSAENGAAIRLVDRPETVIKNCQIEQSGSGRKGIVLKNSEDCQITNSTVRVPGQPILTEDSSVERENLTVEQVAPMRATMTPVESFD